MEMNQTRMRSMNFKIKSANDQLLQTAVPLKNSQQITKKVFSENLQSSFYHLQKIPRVERSSADQATVHIGLIENSFCI